MAPPAAGDMDGAGASPRLRSGRSAPQDADFALGLELGEEGAGGGGGGDLAGGHDLAQGGGVSVVGGFVADDVLQDLI